MINVSVTSLNPPSGAGIQSTVPEGMGRVEGFRSITAVGGRREASSCRPDRLRPVLPDDGGSRRCSPKG